MPQITQQLSMIHQPGWKRMPALPMPLPRTPIPLILVSFGVDAGPLPVAQARLKLRDVGGPVCPGRLTPPMPFPSTPLPLILFSVSIYACSLPVSLA
jgi:hypothetical protein